MSNFTLINNATVGMEVAIRSGFGRGKVRFGYEIIKVTPTGRVTVAHPSTYVDGKPSRTYTFDSAGYEMGPLTSKYHKDQLRFDVQACKDQDEMEGRKARAADAINAVKVEQVRATYTKEAMQAMINDLRNALAFAESAVEAI